MIVREFFDALYSTKTPDEYLAITAIKSGSIHTEFYNDLTDGKLYSFMSECDGTGYNVYFGVGLLDHILPQGRGTKNDICAIPGLWVDIDIEGPNHKKNKLFKTEQTALDVIKSRVGLAPSITVRTGGGLHLYFLFTALWFLHSEDEQVRADRISQGFQTAILRESQLRHGVTIDMTGDITRILRVPETLNKKNRVKCEVIESSIARYAPEQFFQFEAEYPIKLAAPARHRKPVITISSKEGADERLATLLQNDRQFHEDFHRRNSDQHPSASEYDLSLASKLAHMGMEPEQLAHVVLGSRSLVDDKAARRPDYVSRTVARAYVGVRTEDEERLDRIAESPVKPIEALTESERQELLKEISERLTASPRFPVLIKNIVEYTGTQHSYEVVTEHGKFNIGTTDQIEWRRFNTCMMQLEHRTIPVMKSDRWLALVNLMLQAVEMKDTGASGEDEEWLKTYLFDYIREATEYPHEASMQYPKADTDPKVYVKGDDRFIHAMSFKAWLKHETHNEEKQVNSRFAARMTGLGCIPKRLACMVNKKHSAFDVWLIPRAIWDWGGDYGEEFRAEPEKANGAASLNGHGTPNGNGKTPLPGEDETPIDRSDEEPPF